MNRSYYQLQQDLLESLPKNNMKPSLCMHVCCGPCSTFPLSFLCDYFKLTLYFNNSNIYPHEEYSRRLKELKCFLKDAKLEVDLVVTDYDNDAYNKLLEPFKDEPEGQKRCRLCYGLRMDEAYHFANEHHYDYFCTVMSISRQKNSTTLNEIGASLSLKYPNTKYFYSDFKKKDGTLIGQKIAASYHLYRQDYCGCIYSFNKKHLDKE